MPEPPFSLAVQLGEKSGFARGVFMRAEPKGQETRRWTLFGEAPRMARAPLWKPPGGVPASPFY